MTFPSHLCVGFCWERVESGHCSALLDNESFFIFVGVSMTPFSFLLLVALLCLPHVIFPRGPCKGFECDINRRCTEGFRNEKVVHLCGVEMKFDLLS